MSVFRRHTAASPGPGAPPARRRTRWAIWLLLGAVLGLRFVVSPPDRDHPLFPSLARLRGLEPEEPPRQRRMRYRPTEARAPVSEIPRDLWRIHIEIAPKDADVLRSYFWDGWRGRQQEERPEVSATLREGGAVYTNVAIHLKGAAGSFRPLDDKPALTLHFSKHAPGQKFHGYSKISLNNSVQDPTYICEAMSREMFDSVGIPVPRADHATVLINGVDKGLYVLTEGFNKDFLRRYFRNVRGNLYDGGFCQELHPGLSVNSGDRPDDHAGLEALIAAASEPNADRRWDALQQTLDVDRFITGMALEVLICHWDGYSINRNNYRVFHEQDSGRLVFIPHGLDQIWDWPPGRFPTDGPIQPAMNGMVSQAIMATPQGSRQYLERLGHLATNVFKPETLTQRVGELAERIRPTLAAYSPDLATRHEGEVGALCDRIQRRFQSVTDQLTEPRGPLEFDAEGRALITRWRPHSGTNRGGPRMTRVEVEGQPGLRISAGPRGGTASWRSRVTLNEGSYRFQGRARAADLHGDATVCLRLSGMPPAPQPLPGADWVELDYRFEVDAALSEVELVCEFRGSQGGVIYDLPSLRLVRQ